MWKGIRLETGLRYFGKFTNPFSRNRIAGISTSYRCHRRIDVALDELRVYMGVEDRAGRENLAASGVDKGRDKQSEGCKPGQNRPAMLARHKAATLRR